MLAMLAMPGHPWLFTEAHEPLQGRYPFRTIDPRAGDRISQHVVTSRESRIIREKSHAGALPPCRGRFAEPVRARMRLDCTRPCQNASISYNSQPGLREPPPLRDRVLSRDSPTWCSAQSACHGCRLRARRGGPVPRHPLATLRLDAPFRMVLQDLNRCSRSRSSLITEPERRRWVAADGAAPPAAQAPLP